MIRKSGWRIDWRAQLGAIFELTEACAGGVVHIHASNGSPKAAFARVLRAEFASDSRSHPWSSVQIDPDNSNTHYLPDIVRQISKSTGASLDRAENAPVTVQIADNIQAGGAVTISDVAVSIVSEVSAVKLADALYESLDELLSRQRVAILFMDDHKRSAGTLNRIYSVLWAGRLEALLARGLVLIGIFDPADMGKKNSAWPPPADILLDLPSAYDATTKKDALEDIAALALANDLCVTPEQANAFSAAMIASHLDIRSVHAGFTLAVSRLKG